MRRRMIPGHVAKDRANIVPSTVPLRSIQTFCPLNQFNLIRRVDLRSTKAKRPFSRGTPTRQDCAMAKATRYDGGRNSRCGGGAGLYGWPD